MKKASGRVSKLRQEFNEKYVFLGYSILTWIDAAVHWRKEDLSQFTTCNQESVGYIVFDRPNKTFIVLQNYCENPKTFDGTVIPYEWVIRLTPLNKGRSRKVGKWITKVKN